MKNHFFQLMVKSFCKLKHSFFTMPAKNPETLVLLNGIKSMIIHNTF